MGVELLKNIKIPVLLIFPAHVFIPPRPSKHTLLGWDKKFKHLTSVPKESYFFFHAKEGCKRAIVKNGFLYGNLEIPVGIGLVLLI